MNVLRRLPERLYYRRPTYIAGIAIALAVRELSQENLVQLRSLLKSARLNRDTHYIGQFLAELSDFAVSPLRKFVLNRI